MQPGSRRILVIETSGRIGAAALADQAGVVAKQTLPGAMRHAGELMPAIDAMLRSQGWPADSISDVFISVGPGSFTGLRVGVTVGRTLAWSINARVVAVPTVDSLALNALETDQSTPNLAVILDAKQARVFAAAFELRDGTCSKLIDAHIVEPGEFLARCPRPLAVLGEGITHHRQAVDASGAIVLPEPLWWPRVEQVYLVGKRMADAGRFTPANDLLPLYLRRPEAEEKWEKLHGPGGRRIT
jgi:tRNA threonylcarbamoyladenosine biosynthesis protein TsaB